MRRLTAEEFDFVVEDLLGQKDGAGLESLPVDERTAGYTNNAVISLQGSQIEKYQDVARQVAEKAIADLGGLLACDQGQSEEDCAMAFIDRFGKRAMRRPLDPEETEIFQNLYRTKREAVDHPQGVRLVVETMLQFPSFMYRPIVGVETSEPGVKALTGYELASRLSFFLWNSIPDDELLEAAEEGDLNSASGIRAQAERMINDDRFERAMKSFSLQWLNVDVNAPSKDAMEFPNYSPAVWAAARDSVAQFFSYAVRNGGDMSMLMAGPFAFVNKTLGPIYGVSKNSDSFEKVDDAQRAGLMTQAGVMAALGTSAISRPIKRGLFVRNRIFCQDPPPPPPEGVPPFENATPAKTIRQQLEEHRDNPVCASCHAFFDPPGLAFEHYDGVGAYITEDPRNGQTIDASGKLDKTDVNGTFDDAIGMMNLVKDSELVSRCLTVQVFRFAIARLDEDADTCVVDGVLETFKEQGQSLPEMFLSIATSDSFRFTGSP
jgi:hypothetical protein